MPGTRNIDLKLFLQNLKDLDYLSKKLVSEYQTKNEILKGGINDCARCSMHIDRARKNKA